MTDLLSKQQKESEIGVRELAGVSGVFADYLEEHDGKIENITQQLKELKKAVSKDGGELGTEVDLHADLIIYF